MYIVTPILEGKNTPQTSKIGACSAYYTQKLQNRRSFENITTFNTPKSEVLRTFAQKLQNRRFCVVLKILLIIFDTLKSEVLRTIRKNSKIGGFASTTKTPKSEVLRSFENIINNI